MADEIDNILADELLHFPEELKHLFFAMRETVGNEKLVVDISETQHLTIHFGNKSKILDVHITDETKPEDEKYLTLFRIPHDKGAELMKYMADTIIKAAFKIYTERKINIGKLHHHNCIFTRLDGVDDFLQTFVIQKKKKIKLSRSIKKSHAIQLVVTPDDLRKKRTSRLFMVHKMKKGKWLPQGFIWYPPNATNGKPFFVAKKKFNQLQRFILHTLLNKSDELGIFIHEDIKRQLRR